MYIYIYIYSYSRRETRVCPIHIVVLLPKLAEWNVRNTVRSRVPNGLSRILRVSAHFEAACTHSHEKQNQGKAGTRSARLGILETFPFSRPGSLPSAKRSPSLDGDVAAILHANRITFTPKSRCRSASRGTAKQERTSPARSWLDR